MRSRSLRHRAPLLWLVLPCMAGIVVGRVFGLAGLGCELALGAVFTLVALGAGRRYPAAWGFALLAGVFLGGEANFQLHHPRVPGWADVPPREVRVSVRIDRLFSRTDGTAAGIGTLLRGAGRIRELAGQRVYFSLRGEGLIPVRSAVVVCAAVLAPVPPDPPAGSFDRYLSDAGVPFRLSRGRLRAVEQPPADYYVFLEHAADRLNTWLGEGIATKRPDLTAVYRAMMLGHKHELTRDQDNLFMHSGTMHLFAINGLHIGVVALSLHALLALMRCPRPLAAALALSLLWFDVDTTGASPSAVRAFLLVACCEVAFVLRRPANGLASLSAAALIVLLLDPDALFSASFQMSYGVVLTILCFGLPWAERLEERFAPFQHLPKASWSLPQRLWSAMLRKLWPMVGIGLSALLVSSITGPEFFNVVAPLGFVTNLVLVPLATLVIVAGCAAIVAGALGLTGITVLFNHAALLLLVGIDQLIRRGVTAPAAWWPAHWRIDGAAPAALALLLTTVLAGYAFKWQPNRGGWWPPFTVVALALIFGVKFG